MIKKETINQIVETANIIDVISKYMPIKSHGKNYFGKCPFHEEKTQSFSVSEQKQFYYCFGCGASGDSIKFIQEYESISFIDATKKLASMVGVSIEREEKPVGKPYMPKKIRKQFWLDRAVILIFLSDIDRGVDISKNDEDRFWQGLSRSRAAWKKYQI